MHTSFRKSNDRMSLRGHKQYKLYLFMGPWGLDKFPLHLSTKHNRAKRTWLICLWMLWGGCGIKYKMLFDIAIFEFFSIYFFRFFYCKFRYCKIRYAIRCSWMDISDFSLHTPYAKMHQIVAWGYAIIPEMGRIKVIFKIQLS